MLFKLAFRNMRKSVKDYTIYFLTLMFAVAVFYMFNSIESQKAMMKLSESSSEMVEMLVKTIDVVSVFIALVLGLLIVYANNFLIKRRKKEFGIYMTLGMGKMKISGMIILETIFVGIISLIIGLVAGIFLSQLMSVFVAKMFEADVTGYSFVFSANAFIKTCLYFAVMYFAAVLFSALSVSRYKLINLINANRKNETIKIKNPIVSVIVFLIACVMLGYAYWKVTADFDIVEFEIEFDLYLPIILGVVSTFMLFWSMSGFVLKMIMSSKKMYLRDTNVFVLKQLNNKINTTVVSMSLISLMLFMTISALSVSIAYKQYAENEFNKSAPVDVNILRVGQIFSEAKEIPEEYLQRMDTPILDDLKEKGFDEKQLKEYVDIPFYVYTDIEKFFGSDYEKIVNNSTIDMYIQSIEVVKLSNYNRLANLYGNPELSLKDNEYAIVSNMEVMDQYNDHVLQSGKILNLGGKDYQPAYSESQNGFVHMSLGNQNPCVFIVPDSCQFDRADIGYTLFAAKYNYQNDEEKSAIENNVNNIIEKFEIEKFEVQYEDEQDDIQDYYIFYGVISREELLTYTVRSAVILTFLAFYIGITFLITSAAILALKQLTESADNIQRYTILRKIGCDEKMINQSLFRQIGIFFILPLAIGCIHSIFGISFAVNNVLGSYQLIRTNELVTPILLTAVIIAVIYGSYFLATYFVSKNIIKEKR